MAKQIGVNLREARLLDQAIAKNNFRYLTLSEHKIMDKAYEAMRESELYNSIGKDIEDYATNLVNIKCVPEWNRISEEMKPLGELRNKLAEKKAKEEGWTDEDEAQLNGLDKEMSDLSAEYQKVTDEANAELNEYKEKRINEEQGACFFLSEKDYKFVGELCGFYSAN